MGVLYGYLILTILVIIGYMYLKKKYGSGGGGVVGLVFRGTAKVFGFFGSLIRAVV